MAAYCRARGLSVNRCGKLVVARKDADLNTFDTLLSRAQANGVRLERLSLDEARKIEPRVKSVGDCLYSPDTASVNPREVMSALVEDASHAGITICTGSAFKQKRGKVLHIGADQLEAGFVINAAGLYADKVARQFGFSEDYGIMPFKGLYLLADRQGSVRTHIYPVPDISNPFLGVHYTLSSNGQVSVGPTAIPAFWREHYHGVSGFSAAEMASILSQQMGLFWRNDFGFRNLAMQELPKYLKSTMIRLAGELMHEAEKDEFKRWGPAGIRAQLINLKTRSLEMDFVHQGDDRSFHILNAVSPAFTCSLALAKYFVDQFKIDL